MANGKLTDQERKYAKNRARGVGRSQSAVLAGYSGDPHNAAKVEERPDVAEEIARLKAETAQNTKISKEAVAEGLKDAADMAKLMADPQGMVAAWRELGKLLGFYAPEVKKIEKGINKGELRKALEDLKDEDLMQLANGRVVEGEFKRVEEPKALPDLSKDGA
jgi:phage terminase small subunit